MNAINTEPVELLAGLASFAAAGDLSVGKDGFNQHFNYGYMTEAALFTAARAALAEAGLSGTLSFEAGQHEVIATFNKEGQERPGILATVTAVLTIRDAAGNQIECRAFGQGLDPADKAYYKAMTGAAKYAVQKALMIAVESDDTDSQDSGRVGNTSGGMTGLASEKQLGFLCSLVKKLHLASDGYAEGFALRLARMNGDPATEFAKVSKASASSLIERLKSVESNPAASQVITERLVAWETENGLPATVGPTQEDAAPDTDHVGPVRDDDTPF